MASVIWTQPKATQKGVANLGNVPAGAADVGEDIGRQGQHTDPGRVGEFIQRRKRLRGAKLREDLSQKLLSLGRTQAAGLRAGDLRLGTGSEQARPNVSAQAASGGIAFELGALLRRQAQGYRRGGTAVRGVGSFM